jgi:hypothetical protein
MLHNMSKYLKRWRKKQPNNSFRIVIIKPNRCTNLSNLFWKWNSICFGQFLCPSSGVFHCTLSNDMSYRLVDSFRAAAGSGWNSVPSWSCCSKAVCMTYTIAECTVNNSWWWTEELSETCRVSFPKWSWEISASSWFCYKEICHDARSHECKIQTSNIYQQLNFLKQNIRNYKLLFQTEG